MYIVIGWLTDSQRPIETPVTFYMKTKQLPTDITADITATYYTSAGRGGDLTMGRGEWEGRGGVLHTSQRPTTPVQVVWDVIRGVKGEGVGPHRCCFIAP